MSEANKELVRCFYAAGTGDLSGIDDVVAEDYFDHHFLPGMPKGPEGVKQWFSAVLGGVFSGMRVEIDRMLAEGDWVDCHFALVCKHTADFGDLKAKGNAIRIPAISTFRIENGKLAEGWELYDSGDMARQMAA
jgi:predicted SnoaL-like aldol condensation-catalyzing enzyme